MRGGFTFLVSVILLFLSWITTSSSPFGQTSHPAGTSERPAFTRAELSHGQKYVPDEVLVRFRPGTSRRTMLSAHARVAAEVKRGFTAVRSLHLVKVPAGTSLHTALRSYRSDPNVLYAEPNYIVHALTLPNDPLFPQQWGLNNTGQEGGATGADIHARQAWDITQGSPNVVVAVIDSGIDYNHPDLAANVWTAPTGFTSAGQFGTGFTCPAETHGINVVSGTCDPMDDLGHGTHVSGIIGAVGNNSVGVAGVNWNVGLMACKFLDSQGNGGEAGAIACLDFVKAMKDSGVNIIATNNSWGGDFSSQALRDAISAQEQDGILFVAAAGNEFQDNDEVPTYPANLFIPNVVSVAATTRTDALAFFSDIGKRTVHLGAPGQDILSTLPGNNYALETGTSMSAPFVTGVAALLKAANPSWDWRTIRNQILAGGDPIPALADTVTGRRLNAYGALTCSNSTVGSRVQPTGPIVSGAVGTPLNLSYLNINCGQPNGSEQVTVSPSGETITLQDDGNGADQAAGDGIYSGQWTPAAPGSYTLSFSDGDQVPVEVLNSYVPTEVAPADYNYLTITGTNLNLGDDSVVAITSPFPIQLGDGSFSSLYVSSNGTISLTDVFGEFSEILPQYGPPFTFLQPFWQDLYPVAGTDHNVFWDVLGTAPNRQLVVEWRDVQSYECRADASATIKFQVVFTEGSSDVLYNYADTTFGGGCAHDLDEDNGGTATIGLQVAPGKDSEWSFYSQSVADGTALLWRTSTAPPPTNPMPNVTSMSPTSANWGGPKFWLTVNGSGFVEQSRVMFFGYYCYTRYINSGQVMALVPGAYLTYFQPGTFYVSVVNPQPGGGESGLIFTLNHDPPVVTAISPASATAGGFGFLLEVDGQGFALDSVVTWNGQPRETVYFGSTLLFAGILMSDIATSGTAQVGVNNPTPGGGTSSSVQFTIAAATASAAVTASATQTAGGAPGGNSAPGPPGVIPRFLGWKLARRLGPDYMKRFLRKPAGTAFPITAPPGSERGSVSPGTSGFALALNSSLLPGFASANALPTDYLPAAVAAGDFNRDGKMDWAVANGGSNTIWVYLGNGDGTARPPTIIPLHGESPIALVAADLRGTGILDLIVAEADSEKVSVLLGNGDGTFGPETPYPVPGAPLWLIVGRFRKAGQMDIAVALANTAGNSELTLLPGDGTGKFGPPVFQQPPIPLSSWIADYMVEADLNGDGLPDLIINALGYEDGIQEPGVFAYLNNGDGTFSVSQRFVDFPAGNAITSLAVADFDGDGCIDLVDTRITGFASLFLGNCDGTFRNGTSPPKFGIGDIAVTAAVADVNGDGHPDLITTGANFGGDPAIGQQSGSLVSVLLGDGQGGFQPARVYRAGPSMFSLAVADVNGDGHPDILTANQDADSVSVLLNDGTGGFEAPNGSYIGFRNGGIFLGAINSLYDAKMADLNGDGITDIAALEWPYTTAVPYTLDVLLGDSGGNFAVHKRSPVLDASIFVGDYAFGDFRGTGRPDFVSTAEYFSASPYLAFAKNNGDATFTALPITHPSGAQGVLGAGDFNGDGKLDLIVLGNSLTVFLGNGDGTFTTGFTSPFNIYYPFRLFVGDFNGDQKLDVLVRIYNNIAGRQGDNVYEFLGKGDGTFSTPTVVIPNCGVITVGDLNHDGRPDVVELAQPLTDEPIGTPPAYNVYLAQSDGSFQLTNTYQAYAGLNTRSVPTLADFNGDGNLDIPVFQFYPAFPNSATGWIYLQVLLGNGDGTFTPSYTTFDFHESAVPQFMADVTGDGKADLIELDGYTQSAHVIPAVSGQALQARLVSTPILGSQGTVRINLALASSSDTPLQLTASDSALTIPSSVTIPAGSASLDVPFQIGSNFNPNHVFTIAAALGTQTAVAYGWKTDSVNPVGFRLVLNNQSETIAASQATPDYGVYVNEVDGYATTVQLSCSGLPAWAVCQFGTPSMEMPPSTSGNSTLVVTTTSAASIGRYNFKVIATDGTVTDQVTATLGIGDFSMIITPGALTTGPSSSVNFTLTIGDYDGFTGSIALSASGLPSAATLTNLPSSAVAGTYDVTLQTQSVPVGNYLLTVTGTSGSITHSVSVAIQVQSQTPDFTISLSPGTQTTASTGSANYTLTIGAISGFTGNVTVSISGLPSGATVTNLSNSVGAGSYSLTVQTQSVPAGNYTFTITGTSGPLTHIASATLVVQGLSGSVSPTSATLSVGQSASFTVTVSSQYGATGAVSFQCSNVPSGSTCTFNPVSPTLPANGSLSDTLTVQVDSRPAAVPPATPPPWTNRGSLPRTPPPLAVLLMASILLGIVGRRPKLRPAATVLFLIGVASFFMATASCGGGGASSGSPPPPPVTFTITVQASVPGVSAAKTIGTLTITVN